MPELVPAHGGWPVRSIDERTAEALGADVMKKLRRLHFCIAGCGGTGASFAEMLVRTGVLGLALADGSSIEGTSLDRNFCFFPEDCGERKVEALKKRLESIRPDCLGVEAIPDSFRRSEDILATNLRGQRARDAGCNADAVFIGTDTNKSRRAVETLCRDEGNEMHLACGVEVDRQAGRFAFECARAPETPCEREGAGGYGPGNASFASVVHEAVSAAFTMLPSHLKRGNSGFRPYCRECDGNLQPVGTIVNEGSSGNTP